MLKDNIEFIEKCPKYSLNTLFPKDVKNKKTVYTINVIHISRGSLHSVRNFISCMDFKILYSLLYIPFNYLYSF